MPTSITLYGGVAEIGGNKILIETAPYAFQTLGETTRSDDDVRPTRLMLDFGLSFGNEKTFYSGFLQPRALSGIADLLKLGILPTLPGIYRDDLLFESGIDPCPLVWMAFCSPTPTPIMSHMFPILTLPSPV